MRRHVSSLMLLLCVFSLKANAQDSWKWAYLSGKVQSFPYDQEHYFQDGPSAIGYGNGWTSSSGDFYVLENLKGPHKTQFWKFSRVYKTWAKISDVTQQKISFKAPPRPTDLDETTDFVPPEEDYEEAERRAIEKALAERETAKKSATNSDGQEKNADSDGAEQESAISNKNIPEDPPSGEPTVEKSPANKASPGEDADGDNTTETKPPVRQSATSEIVADQTPSEQSHVPEGNVDQAFGENSGEQTPTSVREAEVVRLSFPSKTTTRDTQRGEVSATVRPTGEDDYEEHDAAKNSKHEQPLSTHDGHTVLPEARLDAATAVDFLNDRFFMFGGRGGLSTKRGDHLWMYETTSGKWTLLSGGDIDYNSALCDPLERTTAGDRGKLGPCVVQTSEGYDALMYSNDKLHVLIQRTGTGQDNLPYTMYQLWQFDISQRAWTYIHTEDAHLPTKCTYAAKTIGLSTGDSLWIYRPYVLLGQKTSEGKNEVTGQIWQYEFANNKWTLKFAPAIPLENSATWFYDKFIITYMPGDSNDGVNSVRKRPSITGITLNEDGTWANVERLIVYNTATSKYLALEKPDVKADAIRFPGVGDFAHENSPQRRFGSVLSGSTAFVSETETGSALSMYMFGGSLKNKRNPDTRSDLWEVKLDIDAMASRR